MSPPVPAVFVSTDWLAAHLGDPDLVVVDAAFFMPHENKSAAAEYDARHIPGAVLFDIDAIADHTTALPHMLPTPEAFAAAMSKLGIGETMQIVVYDPGTLRSAPRVWWTLRTYGARDVKILAGGLARWAAEGRPLESGPVQRAARAFVVDFDAEAVVDAAAVLKASTGDAQLFDARSAPRFNGEVDEPRAGLRRGHIPGSHNVPWEEVVQDGALKPPSEIAQIFGKAGLAENRPVIATCGSGVTAAILLLALETIGRSGIKLYDGSWSEWGARADLPAATKLSTAASPSA